MIVANDGSRKIKQKASAMLSWVKAMMLPIVPTAEQTKRNDQSGQLVVRTRSSQWSPRFIRKGMAKTPKLDPMKPARNGETRPSTSLIEPSLNA